MSVELRLLLVVLATWRLAHLLVAEDGPADIIVRLRAWLGDSAAGRAMDCFYCLSLWIAAPMALLVSQDPGTWLLCWWGVAGGAGLLHRLGDKT
jgi:hypothetical protein